MDTAPETTPASPEVLEATTTAPTPEPASPATAQAMQQPWYVEHKTTLIAALVALLILGGAGYYLYATQYKEGGIAVVVNGSKIYKNKVDESIALIEKNATLQGIDLNQEGIHETIKNQAIDVLVNNALLITGAENSGFTATDEEVQKKYDEVVASFGDENAFKARIGEMGLSEATLRDNIRERILADKYIEEQTDIESLTVTDAEVDEFIKSIGTNADPKTIEDAKPQIKAQILSQKQQTIVDELITKLRADAKIEVKI